MSFLNLLTFTPLFRALHAFNQLQQPSSAFLSRGRQIPNKMASRVALHRTLTSHDAIKVLSQKSQGLAAVTFSSYH